MVGLLRAAAIWASAAGWAAKTQRPVRQFGRSGELIEQPAAKPRFLGRVDDHASNSTRRNPGDGFGGSGRLGQRQGKK